MEAPGGRDCCGLWPFSHQAGTVRAHRNHQAGIVRDVTKTVASFGGTITASKSMELGLQVMQQQVTPTLGVIELCNHQVVTHLPLSCAASSSVEREASQEALPLPLGYIPNQ